jgi:Bacterial Ig domain/WD40-like Beta Propeller Repeat
MRRLVLSCVVSALALASFPSLSPATFIPGPNGKITFTTGRASVGIPAPAADDGDARIWVADYPFGIPSQVTTLPANTQHRHPNWSPDHAQIVYAAGAKFSGTYALWIVDLRTGGQREFVAAAAMQDRPSWSPDGESIAYAAGGDLYVKDVDAVGTGPGLKLTETADIDERPVWSPDGETLYFNRGPEVNRDLYKISPVAPSGTVTGILTAATSDWQPALSPDGKRLCFLRGPQNSGADLHTIDVDGTDEDELATTAMVGELNCVWSPDGSEIVYTRGAFSAGDLWVRDADGSNPDDLASMNVPAPHFDGNADWATNFSPVCDPRTVAIGVNEFTSIRLSCTDPDSGFGAAPPTPEPLDESALEIVSGPKNGTLGGLNEGTVIYSPNKDFRGTDTFTTFTYSGEDNESSAAPATVTVNVGLDKPVIGPTPDKAAPLVSGIKISKKRWRLGKKLAAISLAPVGTAISFTLSEAAQATVSFQRALPGRRVGRKCAKPTPANSDGKPCKRYVGAGSLAALAGRAGANRVRFQGRLTRTRSLRPGVYRVRVGAEDAAGNRTAPRTGPGFTIVDE